MASIIGISDVSIGYGSPEVPALLDSICKARGRRGLLIEPDEISRPPIRLDWKPEFDLHRVASTHEDHGPLWHANYKRAAIKLVEKLKPDVLILFGASVFGFLTNLKWKPKRIIYHAYEFISNLNRHDIEAHRLFLSDADLIITPEIDRLIIDTSNINVYPKNIVSIYNVADVSYPHVIKRLDHTERNGRFIWYGTLNKRHAFAQYFLSDELKAFQFDLFGRITDEAAVVLEQDIRSRSNLRYFGVVSPQELNQARANNIFSLVWWNPEVSPGHYFLAPNRFFTSIQAGVPPICPPHPQCVDIIKRYGCGLIIDDWSLPNVELGLRRALKIYERDGYKQLVSNCFDAAEEALNWDHQFRRISPRIDAALQGVA